MNVSQLPAAQNTNKILLHVNENPNVPRLFVQITKYRTRLTVIVFMLISSAAPITIHRMNHPAHAKSLY